MGWQSNVDGSGYDAYDLACLAGYDDIAHALQHKKLFLKYENLKDTIEAASSVVKKEKVWCDTCKEYYLCSYSTEDDTLHQNSVSHQFANLKNKDLNHQSHFYLGCSNKGFNMLRQKGWDGKSGLGPNKSGRKYPVKTKLKRDRSCIGVDDVSVEKVTHYGRNDTKAVELPRKREKRKETLKLKTKLQKQKDMEIDFRRSFH